MKKIRWHEPVHAIHPDTGEPSFEAVGDCTYTVTEDFVRYEYYPIWLEKIKKKFGSNHCFTFNDCLEDFIVDHWAEVIEEE